MVLLLQSWVMDLWSPGAVPNCGGDSSAVQDQLRDVQQIQASAWCLCCNPGRWICGHLGQCRLGGDSSAVQEQLKRCAADPSFLLAFAAILGDGSVVTWGWWPICGGDSSAVQEQLKNVQQIQASFKCMCCNPGRLWSPGALPTMVATAVLYRISCEMCSRSKLLSGICCNPWRTGSVVTWGSAARGGDSSAVQEQLKNVQQIQASRKGAFAAILPADGAVAHLG